MTESSFNIGIFAHADAGKTTITENFLFISGMKKTIGNVDKGTAETDYLKIEKTRGISVRSSYVSFFWKDIQINLIDTPGHIDFSSELERNLRIIDAAILVISAAEGIQAHTEKIWFALKKKNIPIIIFINKTDKVGADTVKVIEDIEEELTNSLAVLQEATNEGQNNASFLSVWNESRINEKTLENLSEFNDDIMESYIEGREIDFEFADEILQQNVKRQKIFPVLTGSAKTSTGIKELLNACIHFFPRTKANENEALSALVFGLSYNEKFGKIALVRMFNGKISKRDTVHNSTEDKENKITQILKIFGGSYKEIDRVHAGDIAGVCGLKDVQTGDILGQPSEYISELIPITTPLLTVQVKPVRPEDFADLAYALHQLSDEDPSLSFDWDKHENELNLKIMGRIQAEILEGILHDRFNIQAFFEEPTIIYKETARKAGEGFVKYWMPKPCWAIMKFSIEPGKRGSGIRYTSEISVDELHQKYQNEVERTIRNALKQGIKGWEVTDIIIKLIEGEDHPIHSRPGDFVIATPMGILDGLKNTGTSLLEPVISFKIAAPEEILGKVISDITKMRGSFEAPLIIERKFTLTGTLPLSTSLDYSIKLNSRSGGKAKISTEFHSYQMCTDEEGILRDYKGISPLDTAKYILKARKALQ